MSEKELQKLEKLLSFTLLAGVLFSCSLISFGALLFLGDHGLEPASFHVFKGEPQFLKDLPDIAAAALSLRPRAIIQLGLTCLIATPLLRVFLSVLLFTALKDFKFSLISLIVLVLLTFGLCFEH